MNKTLKKTLSIIITILIFVTTVPFAFAADASLVINMTDSFGDGWNGNAVKIEQLIDGTYTEVATATIENGNSGTFAIALPEDGLYAFKWVRGEYPDECSFTVAVNGEMVYKTTDASYFKNGQVFYTNCEHNYTDGECDICGYLECQHEGQSGSCKVCGVNLGKLVIDLSEVTSSYIYIGNGYDYYDEDGYIITGTNTNVTIYIYDSCDITFSNMSAYRVRLLSGTEENITVTLDGDNYMYDCFDVIKSHLTINGDDDDTLNIESSLCAISTGGNLGTLTVNGGKINAVTETTRYCPTIWCNGGFTLNGGEVTASNNYDNVIYNKTIINGGTLNVISTSPDREAINGDIEIAKGALLTASATYKVIHSDRNIIPVNEAEENLSIFARFDKDTDFAPVLDIKAALEDKTYAEIKVDTHEHDFDNSGKCICGYECPHENYTDGVCDVCGYVCLHENYTDGVCDVCGESCEHMLVLDGDIKTPVTCSTCDSTIYESDSRWAEDIYENHFEGAVAKFKGYGEGSQDKIVAYYVVNPSDGEEYKLSFDWAINQGFTEYGGFALHLYHNDNAVITRDFTQSANPYESVLSEEYWYTADGEYQVFKFVFEKLYAGRWADGGRKAFLSNIKNEIVTECDKGNHEFINYVKSAEASCGVNAMETAKCENCEVTDTREIEGSALTHSFTKYEEVEAPKCGVVGKEVAECDNGCDATYEKDIPALEHDIVFDEAVAPTCTETGLTEGQHCSRCDDMTVEQEVIPDLGGHIDADGDYLCDNGCGHEFEKPAEPDTPDVPTDGNCDHMCHKTGFVGFIWKIISFLQRFFGIQQYCDCGVLHYEKAIFG